jgi:hypothetical protein
VGAMSPVPQTASAPPATLSKPTGTAACQSECGRRFDLTEGLRSEGKVLMMVHGMAIPFWCSGCGKTICTDCMAKEQGDAITSGSAVSLNLRCGCGGRREMLVTTEYLRVMEEAEKPDPDADHESCLWAAQTRADEGRLNEAVRHMSDAIQIKPEAYDDYFWRGVLRLQLGDRHGAITVLKGALRLAPHD